jgi:hypothetical protein
MDGTETSAQTITCRTARNTCRRFLGKSRFTANTSVKRSCHIRANYPRNFTCHKPELCGVAPAGREHNLQISKGNSTSKGLAGINYSTPPVIQPLSLKRHLCHGLLERGSCVTTERSVAAGENQSAVYSIKLLEMFNQPIKNRDTRQILSNRGEVKRHPVGPKVVVRSAN